MTIGIGIWPALQKVYTVHNTSRLTQCLHSTVLNFYQRAARNPDYCCQLVLSSCHPSVLLPRSSVTTCSSVFTKDDFLQKCAGYTPESKILHLKFQKLVIVYKVVASRFRKNNSRNAFSYQCAYRFILIFILAILITRLMNIILLNYFTIRLIE